MLIMLSLITMKDQEVVITLALNMINVTIMNKYTLIRPILTLMHPLKLLLMTILFTKSQRLKSY